MVGNPDLKIVDDFASTIDSDEKVMLSSNTSSRLYDDKDPFPIVNLDEEESTTVAVGAKKKRKRLVKVSEKKKKKADVVASKSTAQGENIVAPAMEKTSAPPATEKVTTPQVEGGPPQMVCRFLVEDAMYSGMAADIEEVNMAARKYGAHKVAVAGLKRFNRDMPIKAKWFKQFLKESPKKTMHEALIKVLNKLSSEQLPLWESLCEALVKMGASEDTTMFLGDPATVLSKGPSEEEPIPEVLDEYIGIELEEEDDEASKEDVDDTGNSGVQKNAGETSQSHHKDEVLARVQHMISIRMRRFISVMDMLKERTRKVELLMEYISELQNLLLDHNVDFPSFENPEEVVDPRTKSSREELLLRVHTQDKEIIDLKDKLNQIFELLWRILTMDMERLRIMVMILNMETILHIKKIRTLGTICFQILTMVVIIKGIHFMLGTILVSAYMSPKMLSCLERIDKLMDDIEKKNASYFSQEDCYHSNASVYQPPPSQPTLRELAARQPTLRKLAALQSSPCQPTLRQLGSSYQQPPAQPQLTVREAALRDFQSEKGQQLIEEVNQYRLSVGLPEYDPIGNLLKLNKNEKISEDNSLVQSPHPPSQTELEYEELEETKEINRPDILSSPDSSSIYIVVKHDSLILRVGDKNVDTCGHMWSSKSLILGTTSP
ncbi:OLC1v1000584C1 [Oldenlandia corymbosa var. corymbosa]|uniref:OLC1v1000584C1 n=1 Tax=Oldenlandia corymbosa var. corymbosa TaxID=529605 RepID=A0AAV1D688_OLDCO|nr:OLC1v1000584C1 [Oldenlandia corymbosa var. corymbosa]